MIKSTSVIALIMMSTIGFSQQVEPQFSSDNLNLKTFGGYGGPFISATQINNHWGIMIGGKGGVIINQKFAFGGIGMGLASTHNFSGDNFNGNENASLNLSFGGGGMFFEYIHTLENLVQFSIPIYIMAGGASIDENEIEIESSGLFMLEPGINLEFNLSRNFIPGIRFSYRQVFSSLINVSNKNLSGVCIGLVFKFGNFE